MKVVKIVNVGPIKQISIDLNKVNIFIGPQGSGKSTIAKIISYCSWVEKNVSIHQSLEEYKTDPKFFESRLISFHKLHGYFNEKSEIYYSSDIIDIHYKYSSFNIDWKSKHLYKRQKISYIPSERNLVILPEIEKVEFPHNNLRSFLFDWLDSRKKFNIDNCLNILDLDFAYYFNDSNKENHILSKAKESDIQLSEASSGLQSLIPLLTTIEYITNIFYQGGSTSFELDEIRRATSRKLLYEFIVNKIYPDKHYSGSLTDEEVEAVNKEIDEPNEEIQKGISQYHMIMDNLFKTSSSNLIIEEPEQNLFPATQKTFVYNLINKIINPSYEHTLTLTTHSPYVLYAINNCIMYSLVKEKLSEAENAVILCAQSALRPEQVSIYEITDGVLNKIQGKDGLIEENFFDSIMNGLMEGFYTMLNHYD
ncbi:AAA family ATPase [Pedobacter metabolipauper]|uniref:AAA domain-containing protein n=1 Tax=Pedobacter metabolipauper TaxID=425513 RepID=A0A4R6STZ2_9SPHI|nr:AAA family ATPase [Pedobacter metabolipauper]TDQ08436.1 AAA domain-containing protein [Pedobacter metabolipauper]